MTPERWQQLKQIFQSALERNPAERSAFLDHACAGDVTLRNEVESLISSHKQAGDSIEAMAAEAATEMLANEHSDSILGKQFGRYLVLNRLGHGGMGEVFLAEDTSLGRKVALKLLRRDFTSNEERLRRFQQEARAASGLNHPNILTIHEIGHDGPLQFMASEYVEGETLRQHISRARMTLAQALDVAIQVASALAAAHQAGIIHRDIKPENIMLRNDGYVKVLDFGLAKLIDPKTIHTAAPTLPQVETEQGVVMGTFSYMSPEQARGLAVDTRTDIWSLGVMLYEMLAGRQPFEGETASDVMSLILQKEPLPLVHAWPEVPAELERIVRKALHKDKEERYQTVKDLQIDLKNLRKELELSAEIERSVAPVSGRPSSSGQSTAAIAHSTSSAEYIVTEIKQHKLAMALILGAVIMVSAGVLYLFSRRSPLPKQAALLNVTFTQLTDQAGPEYFPSLSPDGKSFVYAGYAEGNWDIYFQRVGGKNPINLTKDSTADDTQPVFSPDGEHIAFRSDREGGGIFVMGATGESVKRLTDFGYNSAWSPDGKEIACADEGIIEPTSRVKAKSQLWAVNVGTGAKRLVTNIDAVQPNWSPHGYRIAYQGRRNGTQRDIFTIAADGGEPVEVTNDPATDWNAVWSPDGKYLYFVSDRGGSMNLWRVAIEEKTGKVLGTPESVTTPSPYVAHLSFSSDGRHIAYSNLIRSGNLKRVGFDPVRETVIGQPVRVTQSSRVAFVPDVSSDGEWLTFDTQTDKQEDIFVVRRDGSGLRQLTDDSYKDRAPRWSPDGKRIVFFSDRTGNWEIWMINADGSGLQQVTYTGGTALNAIWSPDGTRLIYRIVGNSPSIIEVGKSWQQQTPQSLPPSISDRENQFFVWSWSPDGRKLAEHQGRGYAGIILYSFDSQQYERLSDFGGFPVWLSDNRRLLFQTQSKLYLIDSQSKKSHEVLSVAPHEFGNGVSLPRDDRQIYFSLLTTDADIWLMTFQ
jgi:Tol biopolymer transport system component/serine/threonine protein kinase